MRIVIAAFALGLAALAYGVEPAAACSCVAFDARTRLAQAEAAFVGVFVEKREPERVETSADDAVYVFRVQRTVKGRLPATLEVVSAVHGASCGLEVSPGDRIGLLLRRDGSIWRAGLCDQVDADELLAAARPLPAPNGRGPLAFLVGGKLGGVRTFGLDSRGRTLAYGFGRGETLMLSTCPGSRRVVEFASGFTVRQAQFLAVRDLRTFRVVRQWRNRPMRNAFVAGVRCLNAAGSRVAVFESAEVPAAAARIVVGSRVVWRGRARAATFAGGAAYLAAGARANTLLRVELSSGRVQRLAAIPGNTRELSVGPQGKVAGVVYSEPVGRTGPPSRVFVFDPRGRVRLKTVPLSQSNVTGDLGWWRGRLVFLPHWGGDTLRVYDQRLRLLSSLRGWVVGQSVVLGGRAYGVSRGQLVTAALPNGPIRVIRSFATPVTYSVATTPGAARLSGR